MKTKLFGFFIFFLAASVFSTANAANGGDNHDIKIVITAKKIWFVADEMPVKCCNVKVKNSDNKVVLEKCLSSKTADWSLNVESLPKGEYTIHLGNDKSVPFKK